MPTAVLRTVLRSLPSRSISFGLRHSMSVISRCYPFLIVLAIAIAFNQYFLGGWHESQSSSDAPHQQRAMHIQSFPMWVGSGNNYAYLVVDEKSKNAVIIDPANPIEVAPELQKMVDEGKINLTAIVNTHHHPDHAGGNKEMLKQFGKLPVIGGKDCAVVTETPKHGESIKVGENVKLTALHTPCHTQDSICWFAEDGSDRAVFSGDTLFIGGCGRFFEGDGKQMNTALNEVLGKLPSDTKVYPGHEYTKANCKFLSQAAPNDAVTKLKEFAEANKETQGKFTIGDEKKHNVFMRVSDPEVQKYTGETDPVQVMSKLRSMKDNMRDPSGTTKL